jgi:hypothetical protein
MICFSGDLFLGNNKIQIDDDLLEIVNGSAYLVSNFENVFGFKNPIKREDKGAILVTDERCLQHYINCFKNDFVFTLGNNHIHDLGEKGITVTKNVLNLYKRLKYTGVGFRHELLIPCVIEDNGIKIGLLAVSTDIPEVMSIIGTETSQGVLDYSNPVISNIIKQTKRSVDFCIVLPHWGREYITIPSWALRKLAYDWIDAGADLIIGHHPHIIQGKEKYNNKWIYYSLGNYIFPNYVAKSGLIIKWDEINCHSILLEVGFENGIVLREYGLHYDCKSDRLSLSPKSIELLNKHSRPLDTLSITKKKYYGIWQNELFKTMKKEHSFFTKCRKLLKTRHSEMTLFQYYLQKLLKKSQSKLIMKSEKVSK